MFCDNISIVLRIALGVLSLAAPVFAADTEKVLHSFGYVGDGSSPNGMIFGPDGNLYGATNAGGGQYSGGVVFALSPAGGADAVLHDFRQNGGDDGAYPGGLTFDAAGNLYGVTSAGGVHNGGTVFVLTRKSSNKWAETQLYNFCHGPTCLDGTSPDGLALDSAGNLYGITLEGGAYGDGIVFELTPQATGKRKLKVLYNFCKLSNCADGDLPESLMFDAKGDLYGTTIIGGAYGAGAVFRLTPRTDGTWKEEALYSFCSATGCADGSYPSPGLTFDAAGKLYGTTQNGGAYSHGTAFRLTPRSGGTWSESVLYSFCPAGACPDGAYPDSNLTFDSLGNLYGTTSQGGTSNCDYVFTCGTVFELTPGNNGSWNETVLYSFCSVLDCPDGADPTGGVVFDSNGNLYGATVRGGTYSGGTAFELTP
jgi:uncharacterized repeat protein (TIGR03803 family)